MPLSIVEAPVIRQMDAVAAFFDRQVLRLTKHWLLLINLAVAIYASLPFLAPCLMAMGHTMPARIIYLIYMPLCHQLPSRSFFLFGPKLAYSAEELRALAGPGVDPLARHFIGNAALGYRMAYCQRDTAIYTSILVAGLAFALVRRRWRPLPWRAYLALIVPLALDGLAQLLGLHESNPPVRVVTGGLFGLATVWLAYPYLEMGMEEVRRTVSERMRLTQGFGKNQAEFT